MLWTRGGRLTRTLTSTTLWENRLVVAGTVRSQPQTRFSLVGVPVARFTLNHESRQHEAGMEREARCIVPVSAAGDALQGIVGQLAPGSRIRVSGFLSRARDRSGATRLVLHATEIDIIQ